jgi:hypothetical protein
MIKRLVKRGNVTNANDVRCGACSRYDYEGVESEKAEKMMSTLRDIIADPSKVRTSLLLPPICRPCRATGGCADALKDISRPRMSF